MKCDVGDLVIYEDLLAQQTYRGIVTGVINNNVEWSGGGYYVIHWDYPDDFQGFKDDKTSFDLMKVWIKNREAVIFPVVK